MTVGVHASHLSADSAAMFESYSEVGGVVAVVERGRAAFPAVALPGLMGERLWVAFEQLNSPSAGAAVSRHRAG